MEEAMLCPVCENNWNHTDLQPVALPACGHTFCRQCLIKIYRIHGYIACPMCRKVHEGARPEDLPANFILLSLVDPDVQDGQHKIKGPQELPNKPKPKPGTRGEKKAGMSTKTKAIICAAGGRASCVIAAPVLTAAIANGGVAAGSAVAVLQSSGVAGIPAVVNAGIGRGKAVIGGGLTTFVNFPRGKRNNDKAKKGKGK